jgi:hypothetical protein
VDHRHLLTQLHRLTGSLDGERPVLENQLIALTQILRRAVAGSAGLRLTVVHCGHSVTLDATDADARTSLGLPLPVLSPDHEPGGRAVFYSSVPGALDDLAADLTHVLGRGRGLAVTAELDADLPAGTGGWLITGLDELATLNRAAGVLIDQGHHPDAVHQVLRGRAAAGLTPLAHARQLLDAQPRGPHPSPENAPGVRHAPRP